MRDTFAFNVTDEVQELQLEPGTYLVETNGRLARTVCLARRAAPPETPPAAYHQIEPGGRLRVPVADGDRFWVWLAPLAMPDAPKHQLSLSISPWQL